MHVPALKIVFTPEDRIEIISRIEQCLATGQLAQGKNVAEFEAAFARFVEIDHAVAVNSGGAAIGIAMRLLGMVDREVLVPTNTFVATATEVLGVGGKVRLVDVDEKTFSISLANLKERVTRETAAVIVVHIGGIITPEIEDIRDWCNERNLVLFEDAAHAHGSRLNGKQAGHFGCMAGYSFASTKVITTGEGGMIVTNNSEMAERARQLRDYGKPSPWISYHTAVGSNWRMPELSAVIGLVQLRRLEELIKWRAEIADLYTTALSGISQIKPVIPNSPTSWYKYMVLLSPEINRDAFKSAMAARGVKLPGGVYEIPLHKQPIFAHMDGIFPVADDIARRHVCLPIYFGLTKEEAEQVIQTMRTVLLEKDIYQ